MKPFPLTKGKVAIVDEADYEWLDQWPWFYNNGYAARWRRKGEKDGPRYVMMHREIARRKYGRKVKCVDHRDRDTLNNTRRNLRKSTKSQNGANQVRKGLKGVRFRHRKWQARIRVEGKEIYLGSFPKMSEAVEAYNNAALKYFGDFACLTQTD